MWRDESTASILSDVLTLIADKAGPACPPDYLAALFRHEMSQPTARLRAMAVDGEAIPLTVTTNDTTGGELSITRGRGVLAVEATDADGRRVTLVFDTDAFADLIADTAMMWRRARQDRRAGL